MESKKDIDITETVDSSEKHAGNSRAQEGSSVEKAGQDVMDNDETTDEQSREDLHDVSVDEEGRVVAAVREVLASEPNLGVKTILKRIREKFPEVEVDSGQVRAAMQTIAPKRTCAQCNSSKAPFKCTSCNAEYYCSKSCQNLHWKIHKKVCQAESGSSHRRVVDLFPDMSWEDRCQLAARRFAETGLMSPELMRKFGLMPPPPAHPTPAMAVDDDAETAQATEPLPVRLSDEEVRRNSTIGFL
jgi:hypothetical protein